MKIYVVLKDPPDWEVVIAGAFVTLEDAEDYAKGISTFDGEFWVCETTLSGAGE